MLWRVSEGRFDLTSGILRHAWQFEEATHSPAIHQIPELMRHVGWQRLQWASPELTLPGGWRSISAASARSTPSTGLPTGPRASRTIPVLVNFGGDLRCTGAPPASGAWQVGIESLARPGAASEADRAQIRRACDERRCTPSHRPERGALRPHPGCAHRLARARRAAFRHRRRADLLPGRQLLHARHAARRRRRGVPARRKRPLLAPSLKKGKDTLEK